MLGSFISARKRAWRSRREWPSAERLGSRRRRAARSSVEMGVLQMRWGDAVTATGAGRAATPAVVAGAGAGAEGGEAGGTTARAAVVGDDAAAVVGDAFPARVVVDVALAVALAAASLPLVVRRPPPSPKQRRSTARSLIFDLAQPKRPSRQKVCPHESVKGATDVCVSRQMAQR
jgi:hypothetical protein